MKTEHLRHFSDGGLTSVEFSRLSGLSPATSNGYCSDWVRAGVLRCLGSRIDEDSGNVRKVYGLADSGNVGIERRRRVVLMLDAETVAMMDASGLPRWRYVRDLIRGDYGRGR